MSSPSSAPQPEPQPSEPQASNPAAAPLESQASTPAATPPAPTPVLPTAGEAITSLMTGCTYTMGEPIGQGSFGIVYECVDDWNNQLAAKVLRPTKPPHEMQAAAWAEMQKLFQLRHPQVTYLYDAFEYRGVCYIITERC